MIQLKPEYNDDNIITNNNSNSITALVIFVRNKNLLQCFSQARPFQVIT